MQYGSFAQHQQQVVLMQPHGTAANAHHQALQVIEQQQRAGSEVLSGGASFAAAHHAQLLRVGSAQALPTGNGALALAAPGAAQLQQQPWEMRVPSMVVSTSQQLEALSSAARAMEHQRAAGGGGPGVYEEQLGAHAPAEESDSEGPSRHGGKQR